MRQILTLLSILIFFNATAQLKNGVGVHFGGYDFYGPQTGSYLLQNTDTKIEGQKNRIVLWDPSVKLSYWHSFNRFFDLSLGIQVASPQIPNSKKDSAYINTKRLNLSNKKEYPLTAFEAKWAFNFLPKEKYFIAPYLSLGYNLAFSNQNTYMSVPVGLGANVKLARNLFLNWESQYHTALSSSTRTNLYHSLGFIYWWNGGAKKTIAPPKKEEPKVLDTDNDGTPDNVDDCPSLAGRKETKGCPDKDSDGIVDALDDCKDKPGLPQFKGCPDTDNDGIPDNKDGCPNEAGIAKYMGCPIPDTDKDGYNDEVDRCINEYSTTNGGCPEVAQEIKEKIIQAAKGVNFESGKSTLKANSYPNLNKIVEILTQNPELKVEIEGHTDNAGNAEKNMFLSQQRADVCKKYLMDKGIAESRITSTGYGDMKPIADNATKEGKAQNRRTEFILSN